MQPLITNRLGKGVLLALLAAVTFSFMNVFTKMISENIPSSEIVFFRSVFSAIIIIIIMHRGHHSFKGHNVPLLTLRGILGGIGLLGFFYTIANIKLADASILMHLNPLFVVIFAFFFMHEKIPRSYIYLLLLSLIGSMFIIKPGFSNANSFAAMIGVVSAIFAAGAYTCVRALGKKNNTYIIVLYFVVAAMIISFPMMINKFVIPSFLELLILFGVGVTSSLAQLFLTKAYRLEKAGIVAMTGYTGILFNAIWGYVLWNETLDIYSITGGIMIISSCLILTVKKQK